MRSAVPKHLHPLLGRRLVDWVTGAAGEAGADPIVVVTSPDARDAFDAVVAVQEQPLGIEVRAICMRPVGEYRLGVLKPLAQFQLKPPDCPPSAALPGSV